MPSAEQSNEWCEPVDDKAYAMPNLEPCTMMKEKPKL